MDFTTAARIQRLLESGGAASGAHTTLLADLIPGVSARLEEYLGRGAKSEARTDYFDAEPGLVRVVLDAFPVASLTSVRYDTGRTFAAPSDLPASVYTLDSARGILTFDRANFVVSPRAIQVAYTGGMAADTNAFITAFPALAHAADLQVASLIQRRLSLGASSVNAGGGSKAWVGGYDLLPEVRSILDLYRRRAA